MPPQGPGVHDIYILCTPTQNATVGGRIGGSRSRGDGRRAATTEADAWAAEAACLRRWAAAGGGWVAACSRSEEPLRACLGSNHQFTPGQGAREQGQDTPMHCGTGQRRRLERAYDAAWCMPQPCDVAAQRIRIAAPRWASKQFVDGQPAAGGGWDGPGPGQGELGTPLSRLRDCRLGASGPNS